MEKQKKEVGQRIKNIRLENGETLEEFGKRFNTSKVTVFNWEKGRNLPNKNNLKTIAEIGKISVEELLYGSVIEYIRSSLYEIIMDDYNLKKAVKIAWEGILIKIKEDGTLSPTYHSNQIFKDEDMVNLFIDLSFDDFVKFNNSNQNSNTHPLTHDKKSIKLHFINFLHYYTTDKEDGISYKVAQIRDYLEFKFSSYDRYSNDKTLEEVFKHVNSHFSTLPINDNKHEAIQIYYERQMYAQTKDYLNQLDLIFTEYRNNLKAL